MAVWWLVVLQALWLFLPAYLSNMAPVFVGGGRPIDGGRTWKDGNRVLGDGKTWRGLLLAPVVAAIAILVLGVITRATTWGDRGFDDFGPPVVAFVMSYAMGFGGLAGDAVESFFKRRRGLKRGAAWPGFDQLDFVAGGFIAGYAVAGLLAVIGVTNGSWMLARWSFWHVLAIVILTPGLHLLVNWIGFKIGKKDVPW